MTVANAGHNTHRPRFMLRCERHCRRQRSGRHRAHAKTLQSCWIVKFRAGLKERSSFRGRDECNRDVSPTIGSNAQIGGFDKRSMCSSGCVSSSVNSANRQLPPSLLARARRFPLRIRPSTGITISPLPELPNCHVPSENHASETGGPSTSLNCCD